jgi:hypothetical protein
MAVGKGVGTILKQGLTTIGKLTSINPAGKTWDVADITTLDSSDEYKQSLPILKDGGEVTITGFLNTSDAGQVALDTSFEAGTSTAYTITYPATIGCEITFDAFVTNYKTGESNLSDGVGFEATLKVEGKPNIGFTTSTGMSAFEVVATGGGALTAVDYNPAFAIGTFIYGITFTTETGFKVKPTAGSHTIKVFVDNTFFETAISGSAGTLISINANTSKKIDVVVYESAKTSKTYSFTVSRLS